MHLHEAGKVTNRKGVFDGFSVTTFAAGTLALYDWLDGNDDVRFLPVDEVNTPSMIAANRDMVTINGAVMIDLLGQVAADAIGGRQYSGIGGHEDFVAVSGFQLSDRSLVCLPSASTVNGVDPAADRRPVPARDARHHAAPPPRRRGHRVGRRRARGHDRARACLRPRRARAPGLPRRPACLLAGRLSGSAAR